MPRTLQWLRIGLVVVSAAAFIGLVIVIRSMYAVTPPKKPTDQEVAAVVGRFQVSRRILERIVAFEQERDSVLSVLRDSSSWRVDMRYQQSEDSLLALIQAPGSPREGRAWNRYSETFVVTWARRGAGPSAGWWLIGFVHSSTNPERTWDSSRHLDGPWYWFVMKQEM